MKDTSVSGPEEDTEGVMGLCCRVLRPDVSVTSPDRQREERRRTETFED